MGAQRLFSNKKAEAIIMNPPQFGRVEVDNWLVALAGLVTAHGGEIVSEVDALLVKAVGDFVGGMVLKKILAWLSTVNRDYIWKSDRDWDLELGLSYDQMRRVRDKVLSPIVTTYQKSARNRTTHYRLNHTAFFKAVGDVLGLSLLEVKGILGKAKVAFSGKPRVHSGESQETLTKKLTNSSSKETKDNVVVSDDISSSEIESVQMLIDKGFGKASAEKYQALDSEIVKVCIDDVDDKQASNQIKKSYKAYLRGALNIQLKEKQERDKTVLAFGLDEEKTLTPQPSLPQGEGEQSGEAKNIIPLWAEVVVDDTPRWFKSVMWQLEARFSWDMWLYLRGLELVGDGDEVVLRIPKSCPKHILLQANKTILQVVRMARGVGSVRFIRDEV